jgi:hypothetical protein
MSDTDANINATRTFSTDQKNKLIQILNEGMSVMNEIETLQGGLTDTIKAVADGAVRYAGSVAKLLG